ncbi:hypothetical protein CI109_107329 [Kwoniella shandongensis]|uniref:Cytoplasmic protein n=1 Tax=Kwoniella shandongensis TaxID=1734106 RepID=A0AAJ8MZ57_9TREE
MTNDNDQPQSSSTAHATTPFVSEHEPLATELHPISDATITVRVIKSFEFRTQKSLVLQHLDLRSLTVGQLMERVRQEIQKQSGFKPYRTLKLDTMKLYTVAHGSKTSNLIINLNHDEWILDENKILAEVGAQNETELSFFNRESYEAFKLDPEVKWD